VGTWGRLRWMFSAPVTAFNWPQIAANARTIRQLADAMGQGPRQDAQVTEALPDRRIDPERMARALGLSVAEVERRLLNKRRTTARSVRIYLFAATGFLALWLWKVVTTPALASWLYVAGLLAICAAFGLAALWNALVNWQIRTRHLGSFAEFLATDVTWWPS
jgi:hypothetical protein